MANNFTRLALVLLEISFLLVVTLSLAVKIPGYIRGQKTGRLLVRNPGNVNVIFLLSKSYPLEVIFSSSNLEVILGYAHVHLSISDDGESFLSVYQMTTILHSDILK